MLRVIRDVCDSGYEFGWEYSLSASVPARRLRTGDAKVRTGVRRRSGCVTGAGGEASKARNAGVCLRAGWRLRRPSAGAPSASAARRLRRTRPNAERRRRTHGGREQVSGRSAGSTQATVVPKPMRIRGCAGLARYVSASSASDTESRGLGTTLVRARQSAQSVHATVGTPPVHAVRRTLSTRRLLRSAAISICNSPSLFAPALELLSPPQKKHSPQGCS